MTPTASSGFGWGRATVSLSSLGKLTDLLHEGECLPEIAESKRAHMTETLAEKTCTPCRGGVPPLA